MLERVSMSRSNDCAILVGIILPHQQEKQVVDAMNELELLAQTAGVTCVKRYTQKLERPHTKTFIGSGKLASIAEHIKLRPEVNMVIFDDDLSGSQFAAIEKTLKVKVIDRSTLILDIFATHAKTAKAKTQVAMAQYQYLLPRLRGLWKHLERQGGGIGTRGPGETELETDRRIVKGKIAQLAHKIKKIEQQGISQRKNRVGLMHVALSGYTNAGKTALMNILSKEDFASDDKLFVTLDTTTRKISIPPNTYLLSDTVGFIQKIPHHLVESFKSTLEEVRQAHLIVHIIDVAHPNNRKHYDTVRRTLDEIGTSHIDKIIVLNKADLIFEDYEKKKLSVKERQLASHEILEEWKHHTDTPCILLSAHTRENIPSLRNALAKACTQFYATFRKY